MFSSLSSTITATLAPTPSPNLMIKKIDQEIARLQQLRAGIQAQLDERQHIETSEKRIAANVNKFIENFTREHLTALRIISRGRVPKRGKALNELFYWCCASYPGTTTMRGIKLSAIGKHALVVLDKKFTAEDAERAEGLFALYNA